MAGLSAADTWYLNVMTLRSKQILPEDLRIACGLSVDPSIVHQSLVRNYLSESHFRERKWGKEINYISSELKRSLGMLEARRHVNMSVYSNP